MNFEKIKQMVEDGFANKKIAKILQLPEKELKEIIQLNNWKLENDIFNEDKIDHICVLYEQGVSAKSLGIKFSIDKRRIQKWAETKGILRDKGSSHRFTDFNQNIFDNIDTPEKAYWLGFFYADAYNCQQTNTFSITLQQNDANHLIKLAKFVEHKIDKIKYYNSKIGKKEYPTCCLPLYSKHICNKMFELGCQQNKSFIIKYPEWLSTEFNSHFIRGMFDGDGCLTFREKQKEWKWSLVTTKECAENIQQIILKNTDLIVNYHCISETDNNTYQLETSGNEKINKILNWLYINTSENCRLERKYIKYQELIDQQNHRKIGRENYFIPLETKNKIFRDLVSGNKKTSQIATDNKISNKSVLKISESVSTNLFDQIAYIEGKFLTGFYLKTLNNEEKEKLIEPIFDYFRKQGWLFPNLSEDILSHEYQKLFNHKIDLEKNELNNNGHLATNICKHFCNSYYLSTERDSLSMIEIWDNDDLLKKVIKNRLVLDWKSKTNESFNISHKMLIQGMRSMRIVPGITMFKPEIAKYICMKYSNEGDTIGDYSCGFGGRLLGAMSCDRKYIGTDPLTVPELQKMADFYQFKDCQLIQSCSEDYCGEENSIDLYWSSPPYFDQEYYSSDNTQAYNKGEDYFYNIYWKKTLNNIKFMLKPGKWFGLNVKNYPLMFDIACEIFGEVKDIVYLKTKRNHLTKAAGNSKNECIFMFKNNK